MKDKKDILKQKVVELVKEFVKTEGGISLADLRAFFGLYPHQEIITALYHELVLS